MKEFIETAKEGLIVLSLGTTVTPESIPREALAAVGRALRKTPLPLYKVTLVGEYLGWVDLNLGCSSGWWATTVAT